MSEFLPSEIARLVLGYLKQENCQQAYDSFLNSSELLRECREFSKKGRQFSTQVWGKSLITFFDEYSKICLLVQEQLNKFGHHEQVGDSTGNVVDHLKTIFESMEGSHSSPQTMLLRVTLPRSGSRSNRPQNSKCERSKRAAVAHVAVNETDNHNGDSDRDEVDLSNDLDIETTPIASLPGHQSESSTKSRRKSISINKYNKKSNNVQSSPSSSENAINLDINTVQKALLDSKEFHEKIAENINKVIFTPELNTPPMETDYNNELDLMAGSNSNVDKELNSVIKTIVKQTENDPLFERLIDEIVAENQEGVSEDSDSRVNSWSENSTPQRSSSLPREYFQPRRRISNSNGRSLPDLRKGSKKAELPLKSRLRNSKKSVVEQKKQTDPASKIDNQNAEAVQSIIEVTQKTTQISTNSNIVEVVNAKNLIATSSPADVAPTTKIISTEGKIETVPTSSVNLMQRADSSQQLPSNYVMVTTPSVPAQPSTMFLGQEGSAVPTPNIILVQATPNVVYNSVIPSSSQQPQYQFSMPSLTATPAQSAINMSTNPQDIMQMPVVMYTDNSVSCSTKKTSKKKPVPLKPTSRKYRDILPNYQQHPPINITIQPQMNSYLAEPTPLFISESSETKEFITTATIIPPQTEENENISANVTNIITSTTNDKAITENLTNDTQSINNSTTNKQITDNFTTNKQITDDFTTNKRITNFVTNKQITDSFAINKQITDNVTTNKQTTDNVTTNKQTTDNSTTDKQINEADSNTHTDEERDKSMSSTTNKDRDHTTPNLIAASASNELNHNRLSLSTPRSGRSHIRALDFSTPSKQDNQRKANTSPKNKSSTVTEVPLKTARNLFNKIELEPIPESASLFRNDSNTANREKCESHVKVPIATRTPDIKPTADWDQDGIGLMFKNNKSSPRSRKERSLSESDASPVKENTESKSTSSKRDWDADIRKFVPTVPSPIKEKIKKQTRKIIKSNLMKKSPKVVVSKLSKSKSPQKMSLKKKNIKASLSEKRITRSSKLNVSIKNSSITSNKNKPKMGRKKVVEEKKVESTSNVDTQNLIETNSNQNSNDVWINRNTPAKYRRKCNATNVLTTESSNSEYKIEFVSNQVVLKTMDHKIQTSSTESQVIIQSETVNQIKTTDVVAESSTTNITPPENQKSGLLSFALPMSATKNMLPFLETPIKDNFCGIPITPRFMSPLSISDTPITKYLREQTNENHETIIPTPSITPLLAITPKLHTYESPPSYCSRPTDYSSCSSYYVPSDDQHKDIEQILINECNKIENRKIEMNNSFKSNMEQVENSECDKNNTNSSKLDSTDSSSTSSSSSSSSSSDSSCSSDSCWRNDSKSNQTVIQVQKKTNSKETKKDVPKKKAAEEKIIFNELEEKRQRTITKIQKDMVKVPAKRGRPPKNKKISPPEIKIEESKPPAKTNNRKPKATLASLLKVKKKARNKEKTPIRKQGKTDILNKEDDGEFPSLHISSDEDEDEEKEIIRTKELKGCKEPDAESSFAQIEYLKERGILLIPNKKSQQSKSTSATTDKSDEDVTKSNSTENNEDKNDSIETSNEVDKTESNNNSGDIDTQKEKIIEEVENVQSFKVNEIVQVNLENCKALELHHFMQPFTKEETMSPQPENANSHIAESDKESDKDFTNVELNDVIKIAFDETSTKDVPVNIDSETDEKQLMNKSFSQYEIEYDIEGVIRTMGVTSFNETLKIEPTAKAKPKRRTIVRLQPKKVARRRDRDNSDDDYIKHMKTSTPKQPNSEKRNPLDVLYNEVSDISNDTLPSISSLQNSPEKRSSNRMGKLKSNFSSVNERKLKVKEVDVSREEGELSESDSDGSKLSYRSEHPKKVKYLRYEKSNKRKPDSNDADFSTSKKSKQSNPQELLLNLDVDTFLTEVHGPDE